MQHLAVFSKGGIELILSGHKTIESRFSKFKFAPYKKVKSGDIVFMKESGGKVKGKFKVGKVVFLEDLNKQKLQNIKDRYSDRLQVPESFWKRKQQAKYATLIFVKEAESLANPLVLEKHDRRSWVVLADVKGISSRSQLALRFSDRDSISSLTELVKLARKEKGLRRKESMEKLGLNLSAAVGSLARNLATKKKKSQADSDLAEVMISLIKLAEVQGVDLFKATKGHIKESEQKLSLDKLKEIE
ncbi:hypothetical protein ACFL0Z_00575 [Patescibacteria group bacterium]